jgi:hypothetical protein
MQDDMVIAAARPVENFAGKTHVRHAIYPDNQERAKALEAMSKSKLPRQGTTNAS